ncbi:hypothetical protein [Algoriphagus sp.]|nr:hypothetical protein [Algoriphagus sp.]
MSSHISGAKRQYFSEAVFCAAYLKNQKIALRADIKQDSLKTDISA